MFRFSKIQKGFGLTIGSDIFLVIDPRARRALEKSRMPGYRMLHGSFQAQNGTFPLGKAVFGFAKPATLDRNYLLRGKNNTRCFYAPR